MGARTKTAGAVDARAKARERAAAFRERETKLEGLAVNYFTAADRIDAIDVELEESIAKLRERAAERAASAREEANAAIAGMAALSVPAAEIAQRLDLPASAVRAAIRSAAGSDPTAGAGEQTEPEPESDGVGNEWHEGDAA
ncbi:hypothetical protein SAMN06295924_11916 [Rathayibacter rathayi NCPPB 2980 = VKM Ac-1601]|uniref:Uncharacterized protein n=1 Tax=Rathayibacter rathayi TaxID=33887 RepID=A0ABX5AG60_RATRA|nr:hypothetical protein [Rathayibacter rathayi]MWV75926.1 hypothetical protein [Rathayibacter rathayi NCPPB 2980 = VKM Ac-1601]PPG66033.1 hypothetical protein C5C16_12005 [Rathayibacter rathayi]PPG75140.1 hypothetical protein C5C15_13390 [Rathayibacter rathayi]PPG87557.1 hypothetical protein C5C47_10285 [Rathayibacter rathayi]PPG95129.1 hypothetical protein C5C00_10955 [Rathayibacter rathayi]